MYTGILKKYSVSKIVIIKELGGCNVPNDIIFFQCQKYLDAGGGGIWHAISNCAVLDSGCLFGELNLQLYLQVYSLSPTNLCCVNNVLVGMNCQ